MQASGCDVDHAGNDAQQHQHVLSFCLASEAHTEADHPVRGELHCGTPAKQQESSRLADAAPAPLANAGPRPRQEQDEAIAEKQQHEAVVKGIQHAEALALVAVAPTAHGDKDANANSDNTPGQHTCEQTETPAPATLPNEQLASQQPEPEAPLEVFNSMATACDRLPATEAVLVHRQADATQAGLIQEGLPSMPGMQASAHSPEQEPCSDTSQQADSASNSSATGPSQHEMHCTQAGQEMSSGVQEAVYPPRGEGPDPQQLAEAIPTADDTATAHVTSLADDTPLADGAPGADQTPAADNTSMADDTSTAGDMLQEDVVPVANVTPMADDIPMTDGTSMAGYTPVLGDTPMADDTLLPGDTSMPGPAASSSRAVPLSTQGRHTQVATAPLQAGPLQEQEDGMQPHWQPDDGTRSTEQHTDSSQQEQPAGLVPSATCDSELAEIGRHTTKCSWISMSEIPGNSTIVPDSEEPYGDVTEVVAGQLQHASDDALLDAAHMDDENVGLLPSNIQALPSPQQQHGANEALSPITSRVRGADGSHITSSGLDVQGNLRYALVTVMCGTGAICNCQLSKCAVSFLCMASL